MTNKQITASRRSFLSNVSLFSAAGALGFGSLLASCSGRGKEKYVPLRATGEYYIPELPDKAIDGKPLRAALIGCGGRGTGAAVNFLNAADNVSIVACADIIEEKIKRCRNHLKEYKNNVIDDDKCFLGFDAYKKVCELPDVDVVFVATPTLFHPEQAKYAIEQGKHLFCEKPAAIDAVGYRTFMVAVRQAQTNGLCFVTGTHLHHHRGYVESYKKIQEGYIGRIVSGNVYWNQSDIGYVRRQPGWTDMEYMMRDFFNWCWLSGDHVVDQMIHNLDIFVWFSHLKPEHVIGMGSRLRRFSGDCYDNFSVDFEFEGGIHVHGMARQMDNCHNRIGEIIQGTKGSWNSMNNKFSILDLDGKVVWQYDEEANKVKFKQHDPYTLTHVNMVNHIRSGKVFNNAETTAITSIACIMARESAYTGKAYTWDEMVNSDLNFMPSELTMGNVDMSKFARNLIPGITPTRDAIWSY